MPKQGDPAQEFCMPRPGRALTVDQFMGEPGTKEPLISANMGVKIMLQLSRIYGRWPLTEKMKDSLNRRMGYKVSAST